MSAPAATVPAPGPAPSAPPRSAYVDPEHPGSKIKRIRIDTVNRVQEIAATEHRSWAAQLDLIVDAGLRSLGYGPLTAPAETPAGDSQ